MITIIKVTALDNGAHENQTFYRDFTPASLAAFLPEDWAVIPEGMETENFPFGDITVEEVDGVMTVTSWTPGAMPEPEPEPEPEAPEGDSITDADMAAAILEGVNEV